MKKISILLIMCITISLWGLSEDVGTTGFAFAKLNFSPRASAMGFAYAGVADDYEAVFYNPAGLFQHKKSEIAVIYMNYIADINCGALIYSRPLKENINLAFYSKFLSTEETRTLSDDQGNYLGTDGTFGASNIEAGAAAAYHINNTLNIGSTVKFLYESLDSNSASALAFDFGIYHITTNEKLHVGIVLRNIGVQLSSFTESDYEENLPSIIDIGFGYRAHKRLILSADLYRPLKSDFYERFGIEFTPAGIPDDMLKLRLGYKTDGTDWQKGADSDALAGFSGGFALSWYKYSLSYAFLSYGNLGVTNQISLSYKL